ncbi:MAG: UDP-N-acetylglucosamine--N-acetylmuramyl-(pentapeptide) pyrophosphoryl-undecaprenol N-acetylglucosamine transferase [Oscillospiraceae bacterium]|jgi:UDP-N-acetylglucosamine--N-acetylmuramyl-(pentapeptide) pyrophosphoryl-undecaprenol N-acetylglucosamine transferase|nr:UDP-N-acetylglucosamine--N-acetylmuramyl-(pentapeptide) pyrophosphoryl-undecaprenol N-acetylglucosamine transferase [Oscillospiraceae bacterium]
MAYKLLFAAGGTAGHINPALAIADKFKSVFLDTEVLFIGTPDGMEARLVVKAGYPFTGVSLAGLQRSLSPKNFVRNAKAAYWLASSPVKLRRIIKEFAPDVVVGTGGYVSLPVLLAAHRLGIKTVNHESNSLPGLSTKALARTANYILTADEAAVSHISRKEKCIVTGNPLRANITVANRADCLTKLGLPDGITILSFGGSRGAESLSDAVAHLIGEERRIGNINHIHAYGTGREAAFLESLAKYGAVPDPDRTILGEYIYNMYTCYGAADLVIARSGAMTISELKAAGKASVLVPWSGAAENHQYFNAQSLVEKNAAALITDEELTPEKLCEVVLPLIAEREKLAEMGRNAAALMVPDSAGKIVSILLDLINKESPSL